MVYYTKKFGAQAIRWDGRFFHTRGRHWNNLDTGSKLSLCRHDSHTQLTVSNHDISTPPSQTGAIAKDSRETTGEEKDLTLLCCAGGNFRNFHFSVLSSQ